MHQRLPCHKARLFPEQVIGIGNYPWTATSSILSGAGGTVTDRVPSPPPGPDEGRARARRDEKWNRPVVDGPQRGDPAGRGGGGFLPIRCARPVAAGAGRRRRRRPTLAPIHRHGRGRGDRRLHGGDERHSHRFYAHGPLSGLRSPLRGPVPFMPWRGASGGLRQFRRHHLSRGGARRVRGGRAHLPGGSGAAGLRDDRRWAGQEPLRPSAAFLGACVRRRSNVVSASLTPAGARRWHDRPVPACRRSRLPRRRSGQPPCRPEFRREP